MVVFRAEAGPDCPFWTVDGVGLDYTCFPSLAPELVRALVSWCKQSWEIEDGTDGQARWADEDGASTPPWPSVCRPASNSDGTTTTNAGALLVPIPGGAPGLPR